MQAAGQPVEAQMSALVVVPWIVGQARSRGGLV